MGRALLLAWRYICFLIGLCFVDGTEACSRSRGLVVTAFALSGHGPACHLDARRESASGRQPTGRSPRWVRPGVRGHKAGVYTPEPSPRTLFPLFSRSVLTLFPLFSRSVPLVADTPHGPLCGLAASTGGDSRESSRRVAKEGRIG